jgi:hypothetical protein
MGNQEQRGSEKLLAAWKARALSEESVREIAAAFEKSGAKVEKAAVFGGASPSSMQLTLSYEGDDVPRCGNDIVFWLKWLRTHGGTPRPPRIIIDGTPFPDLLRMVLDFGSVPERAPAAEIAELQASEKIG